MWLITPCCTRRAWQRRALKEGTTSQRLEETGLYREVHLCQGSCRLGRAGVRVTKDWIELLHCQNTLKQSATRWQSHSWPHSGNFWRRKPTVTGTRFYRNCSRSQVVRLQIQYIQVSRCMFQQGGLDSSHDSLVKAGHRIYNAPQILPVPGLSPMCCSGGWRICMGGSSFLSPAEENYWSDLIWLAEIILN